MKLVTPIASQIVAAAALCAAFATPALAQQWSTFHGDPQRTGFTPLRPSTAPTLRWTKRIGGPIISSPAIGPDGTIHLGSVWRDTLHPRAFIAALNPDGSPKWHFETGFVDDQVLSSPAIAADGTLYVGAQDGIFYAIGPNGDLRWLYQESSEPIRQHPVVADDGTIYVGIEGKLTAFDPNGGVLWQTALSSINLNGGPSLGRDGTIYAIGGEYGTSVTLNAINPDGTTKWVFPLFNPYFFPLAPPTVAPDDSVITAAESIYAIDANGTLKWFAQPTFGLSGYGSIAVDPSGFIYYTAYVYVWKLDPDGNTVWQYTLTDDGFRLGHSITSILVDGGGNLFVGLGGGKRSHIPLEKKMIVLDSSGRRIGSYSFPEIPGSSSPAIAADGTIYIGNLDGRLYAFNP